MRKPVQRALKRGIDVAGASLGLVVTSPVGAVAAVGTLMTIGRPVFFRQARPGLRGECFTVVKFRTMRDAVGRDGAPLADAERLTRFGSLLRRLSIDEIPQLWNVLKGELSLVGPRPLLMEYLPLYTPEQARRHEVRPGITGWAQINGRNAIGWEQKFALDVWYVEHWSLWLDIRILGKTVVKVLRREGIAGGGVSTMTRFTGSTVDLDEREPG